MNDNHTRLNKQPEQVFYSVTSICREDLYRFYTADVVDMLTDADMQAIATRMEDAYVSQGFWEELEAAAKTLLNHKRTPNAKLEETS